MSSIYGRRGALSASFGSATPRSAPGAPRPRPPVLPLPGAILCLRAALRSAFVLLHACSIALLLVGRYNLERAFPLLDLDVTSQLNTTLKIPSSRAGTYLPCPNEANQHVPPQSKWILVVVLQLRLEAGAASTACRGTQDTGWTSAYRHGKAPGRCARHQPCPRPRWEAGACPGAPARAWRGTGPVRAASHLSSAAEPLHLPLHPPPAHSTNASKFVIEPISCSYGFNTLAATDVVGACSMTGCRCMHQSRANSTREHASESRSAGG